MNKNFETRPGGSPILLRTEKKEEFPAVSRAGRAFLKSEFSRSEWKFFEKFASRLGMPTENFVMAAFKWWIRNPPLFSGAEAEQLRFCEISLRRCAAAVEDAVCGMSPGAGAEAELAALLAKDAADAVARLLETRFVRFPEGALK